MVRFGGAFSFLSVVALLLLVCFCIRMFSFGKVCHWFHGVPVILPHMCLMVHARNGHHFELADALLTMAT